jgi:hypothetical protein
MKLCKARQRGNRYVPSGCGEQAEPAANAPTSSRVPDDNFFKNKLRALVKAEDAQETLNEAAARQREVIEEQAW